MAKKNRKFSVFLLCILLSIPKIIQSRNNCDSLSTLRRNSLQQGVFKFCPNPDSCECKDSNWPGYCHFADDCVGCLHVGRTMLCSQYGGQSSPPVQETCSDDKFMCKGGCMHKIWKKECNGECIERATPCKAVGGNWHCNVSHTPDATDWKCGDICYAGNTIKREDSKYFDCGGICKKKKTHKECNKICVNRDKLCNIDGDLCKVSHQTPSTDWKCGDKCYKREYNSEYKECNGYCLPYYQECKIEETEPTEAQPDEETTMRSETTNNREDKNIKVSENKTTNINKESLICPEGSFACGSQCLEDHLKFVDCDGVCLDKTTLNNGTCPVKQSHTKLIVALSVGIFFFLSLASFAYNAVVTCKKYKAIQPVDKNVEFGITEAPSTFCWVIQHIRFYCSDDMRRAVQQQAEMEIESNPDYGMEVDEYNDPEYNGTELVDYNDYYGDSE